VRGVVGDHRTLVARLGQFGSGLGGPRVGVFAIRDPHAEVSMLDSARS